MAASNPHQRGFIGVDFARSIFSQNNCQKAPEPDSEEWIRGGFELAPSASEAVALS